MARKPGSAQIVLTVHQLILQKMFTDRGTFILVYLRPSSVNEGRQADAHTHTRRVGRQRKRCCVEPEGGISHLRTIKCCSMKNQKEKVRPTGGKKRIPFRTSIEANRKKLPWGRPSGKFTTCTSSAVGMVGKR
ncbi:hypothetical protein CDAR_425141 [Caerostris darwini]|uniref:Uncharacterized protein n=1 Tax=Caerostris darwini TaxID=1538125 RepID=A0AAV4XA41_9ARAC|nr:hypothetical protein CDAR_425141 [Caerostris darwini]